MTQSQLATLLLALPFLALCAAWLIGLACIFRAERRQPVRIPPHDQNIEARFRRAERNEQWQK